MKEDKNTKIRFIYRQENWINHIHREHCLNILSDFKLLHFAPKLFQMLTALHAKKVVTGRNFTKWFDDSV